MILPWSNRAGIYVHIPFCKKKCPYCDFYSITDLKQLDSFVRAAIKEIELLQVATPSVDTVYFGGGTPSLLNPEHILSILDAVRRKFAFQDDVEFTLEVNPGTITRQKLAEYAQLGVNRINIGVQSFEDRFLKTLGRIHNARDAMLSIESARQAGFDNIGIDLMYGIPGQNSRSWKKELNAALMFSPEHISCYMLTLDPNTPMASAIRKKEIKPLTENAAGRLFEMTHRVLTNAGYIHYEISNYAKNSSWASRHNLKYWFFAPYIGIGPSAHSFVNGLRYWNVPSVKEYICRVEAGKLPHAGSEMPDKDQQILEAIYLGLRCSQGICMADFDKRFAVGFEAQFCRAVSLLEKKHLLARHDGHCRLTPKGMRFLDSIVQYLVCDMDRASYVDNASASNPT